MARCWWLFRPFGHPFFIKLRNHPNLLNCSMSSAKLVFYQIRPLNFGVENPLEFMFFQDAIQDPMFPHLSRFYAQQIDLGTPFKIQWGAKWHQNHPSGAQRLIKNIRGTHFFAILKPTRFQKVARSAQGFILYDLLCILLPTWPQFPWVLETILAPSLA